MEILRFEDISVGDRLKVIDLLDRINMKGMIGTVTGVRSVDIICVEFDEPVPNGQGWDCNELTRKAYGREGRAWEFERVESLNFDDQINDMLKNIYG